MNDKKDKETGIKRYGHFGFPVLRNELYVPQFFKEMNNWLSEFDDWSDIPSVLDNNYRLAQTDWREEDTKYIGSVELPGMKKEEIKIHALNGGLEIVAEQYEKKEEKNYHSEIKRNFKTYEKLPKNADLEHIDASYENGVLTLNVPKLEKPIKGEGLEIKIN
jgi:HSP20 family protein